MHRKTGMIAFMLVLALGNQGCIALLAGAGGTVLWQGGKIISEEKATKAAAVSAVKGAFRAQKITKSDEVTKDEVTQLRGESPSHAKVAVDVFETGPKAVRIEIRVGWGDQTASRSLMDEIKKRL